MVSCSFGVWRGKPDLALVSRLVLQGWGQIPPYFLPGVPSNFFSRLSQQSM